MTTIGVILLMVFAGLIGGVVGHEIAKKKFYTPTSKTGASGSGTETNGERKPV